MKVALAAFREVLQRRRAIDDCQLTLKDSNFDMLYCNSLLTCRGALFVSVVSSRSLHVDKVSCILLRAGALLSMMQRF